MLISLDFGITITDILKKDGDGNLTHQMLPSNQKPSEEFILELFKDINYRYFKIIQNKLVKFFLCIVISQFNIKTYTKHNS